MLRKIEVFPPADVHAGRVALEQYGHRFLAEGDSWFSVGTLNPLANSSLLLELAFTRSACAVNCAQPGDTLRRMADAATDPRFVDLLCGPRQRPWDALLVSCGGNDVIEAVSSPPVDAEGRPVPQALRLLLAEPEWGPPEAGARRYLSDAGWQTFSGYLLANLAHLLDLRDQGESRGRPLFVHGYGFPTPRPAGCGLHGPWLLPALVRYAVPESDRTAVAHELLARLAALLAGAAADLVRFPELHFFDSTAVPLVPAAPDARGASGDWVNEIHLTKAGYRKLARAWSRHIEEVLVGAPVPA